MGDDIGTPLDGATVDWRGKRVVDDERDPVVMGRLRETLGIENRERGIRDGLAAVSYTHLKNLSEGGSRLCLSEGRRQSCYKF